MPYRLPGFSYRYCAMYLTGRFNGFEASLSGVKRTAGVPVIYGVLQSEQLTSPNDRISGCISSSSKISPCNIFENGISSLRLSFDILSPNVVTLSHPISISHLGSNCPSSDSSFILPIPSELSLRYLSISATSSSSSLINLINDHNPHISHSGPGARNPRLLGAGAVQALSSQRAARGGVLEYRVGDHVDL
jgi:hypothetical protein